MNAVTVRKGIEPMPFVAVRLLVAGIAAALALSFMGLVSYADGCVRVRVGY